jgi:hypothetical protein
MPCSPRTEEGATAPIEINHPFDEAPPQLLQPAQSLSTRSKRITCPLTTCTSASASDSAARSRPASSRDCLAAARSSRTTSTSAACSATPPAWELSAWGARCRCPPQLLPTISAAPAGACGPTRVCRWAGRSAGVGVVRTKDRMTPWISRSVSVLGGAGRLPCPCSCQLQAADPLLDGGGGVAKSRKRAMALGNEGPPADR